MKILILTTILAILLAFSFVFSMQTETRSESPDESSKITFGTDLPKGSHLAEIKENEAPAIFKFILESDLVVIGSADKSNVVGKQNKKPMGSKDFDIKDWMVGGVYPVNVESVLFSKKAFEDAALPLPIQRLEIFTEKINVSDGGNLVQENRYVLFLKRISKQDKMFNVLDLDSAKDYYETIVGSESIFPHSGPSMEGPSKRGLINLSSNYDSKLVENIRAFCDVLSQDNKDTRLNRLRELSKSTDSALRDNATYAIKFLSRYEDKEL